MYVTTIGLAMLLPSKGIRMGIVFLHKTIQSIVCNFQRAFISNPSIVSAYTVNGISPLLLNRIAGFFVKVLLYKITPYLCLLHINIHDYSISSLQEN